jgi:hypothetical protein
LPAAIIKPADRFVLADVCPAAGPRAVSTFRDHLRWR